MAPILQSFFPSCTVSTGPLLANPHRYGIILLIKCMKTFFTKNQSYCYLLIFFFGSFSLPAQWVQVGQDINGKKAIELVGRSVDISADGKRLVIGAPGSEGRVRIYELEDNSWIQLGQDIESSGDSTTFGEVISLSSRGNRLAIRSVSRQTQDNPTETVQIYDLQNGSWVRLGQDIKAKAPKSLFGFSIALSADGNRVAIGAPYYGVSSQGCVRVYDWNGDEWMQVGEDLNGETLVGLFGRSVALSADGNRLAIGAPTNDSKVKVYDWTGNEWIQLGENILGEEENDRSGESIALSADGNRLALGATNNSENEWRAGHVRAYEWNGITWEQLGSDIDGIGRWDSFGYSLDLSMDGNRLVVGTPSHHSAFLNKGHARIYEWSGKDWEKSGTDIEGWNEDDNLGYSVAMSGNGQHFVIGTPLYDGNGHNAGLVQVYRFTDFAASFSGKIYADINTNCLQEADEKGLSGWKVIAQPGNRYAYTNAQGEYTLYLPDTGTYTLSQEPPNNPNSKLENQICPPEPYQVSFSSFNNELTGYDFANQVRECAILSVDVTANRRRRCLESLTTVSYANSGITAAENVEIQVVFPEYVLPKSSTMPWTSVQDSLYTFILPSLAPGERGRIIITDSVACVEESRGLTQCTRATISPQNSCIDPPGEWNGANLEVFGQCLVIFDPIALLTLKNTGTGDMAEATNYRIYSDNEIIWQDQIQLAAGDSLLLEVPTQGRSIRLEAEQVPFHPDNRQVSVSLEGCGRAGEQVSKGVLNQFAQPDDNLETEIDCQEVVDSYDPNDKLVSPVGITENHYVQPGSTLEYKVRFQNTGTAEAINIEILDTLSEHLEMSSFQMMSASHDYVLDILGDSLNPVLRWRFEDINLPDSTSNEPESHGYVKFKIAPKAETPEGTIVENFADIYFDFNEPIRTNTTISNFTDYQFPRRLVDFCDLVRDAKAGEDQTLCENNTSLSANMPTYGTGQWRVIQGQADLSNASDPNASVSNLALGENILAWTISGGDCAPTTSQVKLTVLPPTSSEAGADQVICQSQSTLSAMAVGGNGQWKVIQGSATFANASDPQTQVSNLTIGENILEWTVSNGLCAASADQVTIIRLAEPSLAQAGEDQTVCTPTTQLDALAPTSGQGVWTLIQGSGTIADPGNPRSLVSELGTGQNIFRWSVANGICDASHSEVSISRVEVVPMALGIQADTTEICAGTAVTFEALAQNPGANPVYTWYLNGNALGENQAIFQTNQLANGDEIWVELRADQICPSLERVTSDRITMQVYPQPQTPTILHENLYKLRSSVASAQAYRWYRDGVLLADTSQSIQVSQLGNYEVEIESERCGRQRSEAYVLDQEALAAFAKNFQVKIYPNPSSGKFTLEILNNRGQALRLTLVDTQGKIRADWAFSESDQIDFQEEISLPALPQGQYWLRLEGENFQQVIFLQLQ